MIWRLRNFEPKRSAHFFLLLVRSCWRLNVCQHDCIDADDYVVFASNIILCPDIVEPWVSAEYRQMVESEHGGLRRESAATCANFFSCHCRTKAALPGIAILQRGQYPGPLCCPSWCDSVRASSFAEACWVFDFHQLFARLLHPLLGQSRVVGWQV